MPAAIAAVAASAGGALAASNSAPSGFKLPKYGPYEAAFTPQILAFLQAGGDLGSIMASKQKGKKGLYLSDGTKVNKADTIRFGGNRVAVTGDATRGLYEKQFELAQQKQIDQTQKNFNLLFGEGGPPVLKDLIQNRPQQIREALGPSAGRLLRDALGGAAPRGTLTTDAVLQRASAPTAFAFEQYVQQAQDVANAQQLGLSGVPGFGGGFSADPQNFLSPQSIPTLQNLSLAAYGQGVFNPALASQQSRMQAQGFKAGLYGGLGGGVSQGLFGLSEP